MVRPASESATPRSTIAANASSLTSSSSELSSGWSSIMRINCSLAGLMRSFYRPKAVESHLAPAEHPRKLRRAPAVLAPDTRADSFTRLLGVSPYRGSYPIMGPRHAQAPDSQATRYSKAVEVVRS